MSDSDKPVFKRSSAGQALHFTVTLMRPRELREWMDDSSPENGTYVALVVAPNAVEAVAIARAEVYAADKKDGAGKYIRDLPPPRPHDPPKLKFEPECYPVVFVQAGRHEVLYFGWQIEQFQPSKSAKRAHDKLAGGNETLPRNAQENKDPFIAALDTHEVRSRSRGLAADEAFADLEFPKGWEYEARDGWEYTTGSREYSCKCYVRPPDLDGESPSVVVNVVVTFKEPSGKTDDHTVESVTAADKNGILASHTPAAEEPAGMTP
jgi:hypothetical protein